MVNLKNRKTSSQTYKKKLVGFWSKVLWTDETKNNLHQNNEKAWRKKHLNSSRSKATASSLLMISLLMEVAG